MKNIETFFPRYTLLFESLEKRKVDSKEKKIITLKKKKKKMLLHFFKIMHTDEMFTITPETFIKVNSIRFNFMLSLSF